MATYKDVTRDMREGNAGGLVFGAADGSLIRAGQSTAGTKGIRKSTDNGETWPLKHTFSVQGWESRLAFRDSNDNLYVGTINTTTPGKIIRSTDNGENWSEVATSEGSGWWRMCEQPTTGYLYASEYSIGNKDANELYAYNIWRSTDQGATWAKFYSATPQSAPGAADSIRHIHGVYCSSVGTLFTGFGDVPQFSGDAGKSCILNDNGTLGAVVDNTANGFTAFCETAAGNVFFGGDSSPIKIYLYNAGSQNVSVSVNLLDQFGSYFASAVLDMIVGDNGGIYALTNGATNQPSSIIASGDEGATWVLLKYTNDLNGATQLTKGNGRIFTGRAQSGGPNYMSIPDYQRGEITNKRVLIR